LPNSLLDKLNSICVRYSKKKLVSELKVQVSSSLTGLSFTWQSPCSKPTHLIASSTKMFAATVLQQLVDEQKLSLYDSIADHLPTNDYENLNVQDSVDFSNQITLRDLLAHTSGIADYYQLKRLPKNSDLAQFSAQDPGWNFEEALDIARGLPPKFPPHSGKAHYSFTNYQLVGRIIEAVENQPLSEVFRTRIFEPLSLNQTGLLTLGNLDLLSNASQVLAGKQRYLGSRRIASLGAEGAIVSSTQDTTKFLKAFFEQGLISEIGRESLLSNFLPIFPSINYAAGVMSLGLPRFATRAKSDVRYLGHSGATGHLMFYDPMQKLTIVVTINQLQPSTIPYRLMASVLRVINSA
jgi:D-alanyl-D-alanine carboxypeptidase